METSESEKNSSFLGSDDFGPVWLSDQSTKSPRQTFGKEHTNFGWFSFYWPSQMRVSDVGIVV